MMQRMSQSTRRILFFLFFLSGFSSLAYQMVWTRMAFASFGIITPVLSVVLFRREGWDRADYEQWSNRLLADQIGFVTPTSWEGEPVARFAFLHPDTSLEMVGEILASTA